MSDDLDMHALQFAMNGGLKERAEAALRGGLRCGAAVLGRARAKCRRPPRAAPTLSGLSLVRARAVESFAKRPPREFDAEAGWRRFKELHKEGDGKVA